MTKKNVVGWLERDPRFVRPKRKETKLKVDSRFSSMFTDRQFTAPIKVDKYGRRLKGGTQATHDLKRYYRLESDQEEMEADESEESEESEQESSSSDDSSDSNVDHQEEQLMDERLSAHPLVNSNVQMGEASRRLAVVNLDWDQIGAQDILQMVEAFRPPMGRIFSVKIFPSQFGKERMKQEELEGPPAEIFINPTKEDEDSAESGDFGNSEDSADSADSSVDEPTMVDEGAEFNNTALRKYQLERLRYYYAVIECDSVETAMAIYQKCDGSEFEMSANFIDMRFIPEELNFEDECPKDEATVPSPNYRPKTDLETAALQHSKVKLTWDSADADRRALLSSTARVDWKENDLKAYLASCSSEDEVADRNVDQLRKLLSENSAGAFGRSSRQGEVTMVLDEDCETIDKEATFTIKEEEAESSDESLTVFERYLKRQKAKKEAKREARQAAIQAKIEAERKELEDQKKKSLSKKQRTADDSTTPLDLLLLPDHHVKVAAKDSLNLADPRFAALYESPDYALDPSNPHFKPTPAIKQIIAERQRRRNKKDL